MLSTRVFKSSGAATSYYSHGDYYGSEGEGIWFGEGAKDLGLTGDFVAKSDKSFSDLLKGVMPNGQRLARKTKDGLEHCPGVDLTFSAPKSFSIQMLVYSKPEDKQAMETALMKSVTNTLKYIEEKGYVVARKGHNGVDKEPINKLAFATFMHTTNRNLEPQAHVHCFLANAAKCQDNKFRSISFDKILQNNKFFGQVFRNELAIETKKLGYEITPIILSDGSSSFELSKIDNKLIQGFSSRRKEIEELCKLYNVTTKLGRDSIVINSRKAKRLSHQGELSNVWSTLEQKIQQEIAQEEITKDHLNKANEEATQTKALTPFTKAYNFIVDKFSSSTFKEKDKPRIDQAPTSSLTLTDLAHLCIEDITHHNSVFSNEELAKKTLKFAIGNYTIREIDAEHQKLEQAGILVRYGDLYTSQSLLNQEKYILKHAQNAIGGCKSILEEKYFAAHFDKFCRRELAKNSNFQMNKEQQKLVKHILSSEDKIITVVGLPGVGKSTVLNAVRDIADHKIISLVFNQASFEGLAPTASAAKTLGIALKQESNTIHNFLGRYQGYIEGRGSKESLSNLEKTFKNTMIFVDEASLIPTYIMHKLTFLQKILKFRMVLVGDTKQLAAVEAGKPFEQILQIISPFRLTKIVRQSLENHRIAIIEASEGKVKETFAIHNNNILEESNLKQEATKLYLQSDKEKRNNTLLVSPTRDLRDKINDDIRLGLQLEKSLKGEELKFSSLRQKDMSIADYQFAHVFKVGDVLKFHKAYNAIKKDEYLQIKQVNHLSNNLILKKENGKEVMFYLKKEVDYKSKFEVFERRELKLQEGLKIIFTKNNKDHRLINSETAIIKQINQKDMLLQFENNLSTKIPLLALKHIDYGYCITVHSSQGKTFDNTIAAINNHPLLNEQKSWLVTLSRHRNELTILTQDKQRLEKTLIQNDGRQTSAIELQSITSLKSTDIALSMDKNHVRTEEEISSIQQDNALNDANKSNKAIQEIPSSKDKKVEIEI
jgi:conjugative relaxase-like TrwC/TraI family protein